MSNEKITNLNQVEGFNPEDYARLITDNSGENPRKYLDVMWRKVWFYLKYPNGRITINIVNLTTAFVIVEAKVYFDRNDPAESYIASGMAQRWFKPGDVFGERAVETAETGAIGRALANAGFGLQYCSDMNEGKEQEIVDTPIQQKQPVNTASPKPETPVKPAAPADNKAQANPTANAENKAGNGSVQKPNTTPNVPVTPSVNSGNLTNPLGLITDSTNSLANHSTNETPAKNIADNTGKSDNTKIEDIPAASDNKQENNTQAEQPRYNNSMEVNEIKELMTINNVFDYPITVGKNRGKTIGEIGGNTAGEVIKQLEWYYTSYSGQDNCLRAAAKKMAEFIDNADKKAKAEKAAA